MWLWLLDHPVGKSTTKTYLKILKEPILQLDTGDDPKSIDRKGRLTTLSSDKCVK